MKIPHIIIISVIIGVSIGAAAGYWFKLDEINSRNYAEQVEQGIQSNMDDGFVNCYPPNLIKSDLKKEVAESSETQTVCRKKVGDVVQIITFTKSN